MEALVEMARGRFNTRLPYINLLISVHCSGAGEIKERNVNECAVLQIHPVRGSSAYTIYTLQDVSMSPSSLASGGTPVHHSTCTPAEPSRLHDELNRWHD